MHGIGRRPFEPLRDPKGLERDPKWGGVRGGVKAPEAALGEGEGEGRFGGRVLGGGGNFFFYFLVLSLLGASKHEI